MISLELEISINAVGSAWRIKFLSFTAWLRRMVVMITVLRWWVNAPWA